MIYSEYEELFNEGIEFGVDTSFIISKYGGKCSVNNYIAFKLSSVSSKYERDNVIPILKAPGQNPFAYLLTCRDRGFGYGSASDLLVAAFLEDARPSDIADDAGKDRRDFVFRADYIVINTSNQTEYLRDFRTGSGLWGGFVHVEELASKRPVYQSRISSILATPDVQISSDSEKDVLWRAIDQTAPLERYLKLYHLIELMFDLTLVEKIKLLGADLKGIGKLLKSYSSDSETERLLKIVKEHCPDTVFFEAALSRAFSNSKYHAQLLEMLFEYSKESNPYKEEKQNDFKNVLQAGFSVSELKNHKLAYDYNCLSKLAVYVLYRVRCSIAHSKIGEFILTQSDEEFVAEVAEPLLTDILIKIYAP